MVTALAPHSHCLLLRALLARLERARRQRRQTLGGVGNQPEGSAEGTLQAQVHDEVGEDVATSVAGMRGTLGLSELMHAVRVVAGLSELALPASLVELLAALFANGEGQLCREQLEQWLHPLCQPSSDNDADLNACLPPQPTRSPQLLLPGYRKGARAAKGAPARALLAELAGRLRTAAGGVSPAWCARVWPRRDGLSWAAFQLLIARHFPASSRLRGAGNRPLSPALSSTYSTNNGNGASRSGESEKGCDPGLLAAGDTQMLRSVCPPRPPALSSADHFPLPPPVLRRELFERLDQDGRGVDPDEWLGWLYPHAVRPPTLSDPRPLDPHDLLFCAGQSLQPFFIAITTIMI